MAAKLATEFCVGTGWKIFKSKLFVLAKSTNPSIPQHTMSMRNKYERKIYYDWPYIFSVRVVNMQILRISLHL